VLPVEIIKAKREGLEIPQKQLKDFVNSFVAGEIPQYQMAAFLMATYYSGMTDLETSQLTQIMIDSGKTVSFSRPHVCIDKHSTGGVGDKTSLILAPIAAACGVQVPMMSGRGLGHTGGTVDKLESIPGFNIEMNLKDFQNQVENLGLAMICQTDDICPADKMMYALRDVTGTVESLPLICASIMSKKIAEGIGGLVLDVKWGNGAFMKTIEEAKALRDGLESIAKEHSLMVSSLITNMNQPLGAFVGNSLEVFEAQAILAGTDCLGISKSQFEDCRTLSLELASLMVAQGKKITLDKAQKQTHEALESGAALKKWEELCHQQGGKLNELACAKKRIPVVAPADGFITAINCESLGYVAIELGAGRKALGDPINPTTGLILHHKLGAKIRKGDTVIELVTEEESEASVKAFERASQSFLVGPSQPDLAPLISDR